MYTPRDYDNDVCDFDMSQVGVTPVPGPLPKDMTYKSGFKGVSWNRRMNAWLAFWSENKLRKSKTFSARQIGFEEARVAAIEFLKTKRDELKRSRGRQSDENNDDWTKPVCRSEIISLPSSSSSTIKTTPNVSPRMLPIGINYMYKSYTPPPPCNKIEGKTCKNMMEVLRSCADLLASPLGCPQSDPNGNIDYKGDINPLDWSLNESFLDRDLQLGGRSIRRSQNGASGCLASIDDNLPDVCRLSCENSTFLY
eukprot:GHVL01024601.1.p1 GENE.GHVL01024601.1~~GHVL01024601.1.p1  ORF type:complete len:253 (+),score=32.90 GHVL01024601.1:45-803(+)